MNRERPKRNIIQKKFVSANLTFNSFRDHRIQRLYRLVICINHIAVFPLCYVIVRSADRIRSDVINDQCMNHLLFGLEVKDRLADVNRSLLLTQIMHWAFEVFL